MMLRWFDGDGGVVLDKIGAPGRVRSGASMLPGSRHVPAWHVRPGGHSSFGPHMILLSSKCGEKQPARKTTDTPNLKIDIL
jgi:hypothetical protein